jgi:hypothetical protein
MPSTHGSSEAGPHTVPLASFERRPRADHESLAGELPFNDVAQNAKEANTTCQNKEQ